MKRPLFPLDFGPLVELSDEQHVAVWIGCAVVLVSAVVGGIWWLA